MSFAFDLATELTSVTCANCAMTFAAPAHFLSSRRNDHASFYCPSGHKNFYPGESEVEKLKKELEKQKQRTAWAESSRDYANKRAKHEEYRARAYKGKLTHVKRRVSNGVCPCCNRTFQNLMSHMKNQHPNYNAQQPTHKESP